MLRNIKCLVDTAPSMSYCRKKIWKQTFSVYAQSLNLSCHKHFSLMLPSITRSVNCNSVISQQKCYSHQKVHKNIHSDKQRLRNNIRFVNEFSSKHRSIFAAQKNSYSTKTEELVNPIDKLQVYVGKYR